MSIGQNNTNSLGNLPSLPEPLSGNVLYQAQNNELRMQIREDANWRWLVFLNSQTDNQRGITPIQSLQFKPEPDRLIPVYMQVLCAGLALTTSNSTSDKTCTKTSTGTSATKNTHTILQLGLGGGAINRFLLNQPDVQYLATVERYAEIIEIYRNYFGGHSLDNLETLHLNSAERFLAKSGDKRFNYILLDLFDQNGMPEYCYQPAFYKALLKRLEENGIIAINVPFWTHNSLQTVFIALRKHFNHVAFIEIPAHENLVLFASGQTIRVDNNKFEQINNQLDIDAAMYLENLVIAPPI